MWSGTALLIAVGLLPLLIGGKVFDVTTIYDVENLCKTKSTHGNVTGRVHSRTNALGLAVSSSNGLLAAFPHHESQNLTCDLSDNNCSWNIKNWVHHNETIDIKPGTSYKQHKNLILIFEDMQDETVYRLIFTENHSNIRSQRDYVLIEFTRYVDIFPWQYTLNVYRGCSTDKEGSDKMSLLSMDDRDGDSISIYCDLAMDSFSVPDRSYSNVVPLTPTFFGGEVKIFFDTNTENTLAGTWSEMLLDVYAKYKFFSFHGPSNPKLKVPVVKASQEGSEIISPPVTTNSGKLCLMLELYSTAGTEDDVLEVLAQDLYLNGLDFQLQKVNNIKTGWNIKHLNLIIDSEVIIPVKLVIKKVGSEDVSISKISGCSIDGEEVRDFFPQTVELCQKRLQYGDNVTSSPLVVFSADTYDYEIVVNNKTKHCLNGGGLSGEGCSCPPGFHGQNCQSGCGSNRFGQDCGGLCSSGPRQCQGLLLCTFDTSCHCAPGYKGRYCEAKCPPGRYGNDCDQVCGRCASGGSCDIYTGKCSACELGYLHPYCKQETVYYSSWPALSSPAYGTIVVTFDPEKYKTDDDPPELYQLQYKEEGGEWRIYTTKTIPERDETWEEVQTVSEEVTGLKTGVVYQLRVLMLDANFNKYDGPLVKTAEILTKCDVPDEYDYKVNSKSNTTSLKFSWSYENTTEFWCPLVSYDISWKYGGSWIDEVIPRDEESFTLTDLLPSLTVQFKVQAYTIGGYAPYSTVTQVSTQHSGTFEVRDLRVLTTESFSAKLSWEPPRYSDGRHLEYTVSYKCVDQPACSAGCHNATEGVTTTDNTGLTLSSLLPFSQYLVTVTPENGQQSSIYVGTKEVLPTETPIQSSRRPERSNTSLTVFWDPQPVCSSFLQGYNYQLLRASDSQKVLASGFTKDTSATFHNLTASTEYVVRVFITTLAGWNAQAFLAINISTSATVPEAVRQLAVYKRGRGMLGLRWAAPSATYGPLKSFSVRHGMGQEETTHTVGLTRCPVWPDLYCHTIEGLRANRKYSITVSARNSEVSEDGVGTSVVALTKETFPTVPENLKVMNTSSTSVGLQWGYPNLANGVIRSFVINVEETEMFDQDSCCQDYPLVETPVTQESQTYEGEVSGLHPASTYFVSVTAKTVGLGPSQSLVLYTRPPHLVFNELPQLQYKTDQEVTWLPQEQLPQLNSSDRYTVLVKTHLLLAVTNLNVSVSNDSGILKPELNDLLQTMITDPFFFVTEYNQDQEVFLSSVEDDGESEWGRHPSPSPLTAGQRYQLIAVQVTEYNGVFNADLRYTNTFTLLSST